MEADFRSPQTNDINSESEQIVTKPFDEQTLLNKSPHQLREQLATTIRSVATGFRGDGAARALYERIRTYFSVQRVDCLTTTQTIEAIRMTEQMRKSTHQWIAATHRIEREYIQQILKAPAATLHSPTLVCLAPDQATGRITAPLQHANLDSFQLSALLSYENEQTN